MQRSAQYTTDNQHRIISVTNGDWRLQHYTGAKGSKTFDPWYNLGPPVGFAIAEGLLRARQPVKAAVQS